MSRKSRHRTPQGAKHELRTPAFESLDPEEQQLRSRLITQVGNSFYVSGMALIQLKELRLYRNTHFTFNEFCLNIFGYRARLCLSKNGSSKNLSKPNG